MFICMVIEKAKIFTSGIIHCWYVLEFIEVLSPWKKSLMVLRPWPSNSRSLLHLECPFCVICFTYFPVLFYCFFLTLSSLDHLVINMYIRKNIKIYIINIYNFVLFKVIYIALQLLY